MFKRASIHLRQLIGEVISHNYDIYKKNVLSKISMDETNPEEKADEIEKEREETQEQNNIIKRIKDTDKIFEMLFNHELLVNKNLIYGKLNNLYIKKPFMFILNVKYYQWKHPELKNNEMFNKIENIRELVQDASKDDVLDDYTRKHQRKTENLQVEEIDFHFSLPMKEEAKRILLVIGNRILQKYPSVDIKGSIEIDEINGLCSMLFYNPMYCVKYNNF